MPTFGTVCDGIGCGHLAFNQVGFECAWSFEIEPFPSAVLAYRFPEVTNHGDMNKCAEMILSGKIDAPDVFIGGTPCQSWSVAGKRKGLEDARGNLSLTFCGIADAVDDVRRRDGKPPCVVLWENVPGVLSDKGNGFGCILGELSGAGCEIKPPGGKWGNAGCVFGPKRTAAFRVLDSQYYGVAQRRRRVFVVASAGEGIRPEEVLFEFDGLRRDSPPSREAWEGVTHDLAPCLTSGGRGVERAGESRGQDPVVACMAHGQANAEICENQSPTLNCNHEVPIAFERRFVRTSGGQPSVNLQPCLRADANTGDGAPCVAFDTTQITSPGNYSRPKQGDPCHPLASGAHPPCVAIQDVRGLDKKQNGRGYNADGTSYTVDAMATQGVAFCELTSVEESDALLLQSLERKVSNGTASETDACEILRLLRKTIGEKAYEEWCTNIITSFQPPEVLRQALHG